jgi:hypothetical protein
MITCDPKLNVYVTDSGAIVPRVSSICRLLDPDAFLHVSDSAMATASVRGTWVHEAIDRFHTAGHWEVGHADIDSIVAPYMPCYFEFLSDTGAEPLEGEKVVSHRLYGYAGRLDKIYRIRGRLTVLDFKVTAAMPKTVWVQLAAYVEAENDGRKAANSERPVAPGDDYPYDRLPMITERAALRLRPNEKYQLRRPTDPFPEDLRVFLALLQIHNWKEKNNVIKPKF